MSDDTSGLLVEALIMLGRGAIFAVALVGWLAIMTAIGYIAAVIFA